MRDVTQVDELRLREAGEGGIEESGVVEDEASVRLQWAQMKRLKPHPRQLLQIASLLLVSFGTVCGILAGLPWGVAGATSAG